MSDMNYRWKWTNGISDYRQALEITSQQEADEFSREAVHFLAGMCQDDAQRALENHISCLMERAGSWLRNGEEKAALRAYFPDRASIEASLKRSDGVSWAVAQNLATK